MTTEFWITALLNSLVIALGVSAISLLIALPMAWLVERSNLPGASMLGRLLSLPYVIPSYLLAISWITLANPSVGWINKIASQILGSETSLVNIYNLFGIIFIESSALFAIVFLAFRSGLRRMDPALEEAARLAGASPLRIFWSITCPLLKNTIIVSVIAVALASLASFGVPAMIGGPARIFVLTTGIFSMLKQGTLGAQGEAITIAIEMGLVAVVLVFVSRFFNKQQTSLVGGKTSRPALVDLGKYRIFGSVLAWGIWFLIALLPIAVLILSSFQSNPASLNFADFSFKAWEYVLFTLPDFRQSVTNSLFVSFIASTIVLVLSLTLALVSWQGYYSRKKRLRFVGALAEDAALLAYSLPGTVIAVLLIFFSTRFSFLNLSDTLGILVLALVVKYLTLGLRTLGPAAFLIHPSLIEAAKLSGASFPQRLLYIWIPLLKPALFAALLLVFMPSVSELTMTILLYGPGTETLGVTLFNLQEYADRASASVVGTLLLIVVVSFQFIAGRVMHEH